MNPRLAALALPTLLLAACGGSSDDPGSRPDGAQDPLLPVPQAGRSGVTGMPDAGAPGPQPAVEPATPAVPADAQGNSILPGAVAGEDGPDPLADGGAGSDAALAVLRDYYGAINAGDFAAAHGLWADGGRASNQSPEAFAQGFAGMRGVSVEFGPPGVLDGDGVARMVQVPVTLVATQADGTERRQAGRYTLRRGDGASGDGPWRITAADVADVAP